MYNKKVLSEAVAKLGKKKTSKPYSKDIIKDPAGQWKYPGENTRIPSNQITMKGVNYPVWAQPNVGQGTLMYPGEDYHFPNADYVDEYPQLSKGGIPDLPLRTNRKAFKDWTYSFEKRQEGGNSNYIELELTPEEIKQYRDGGYVVEDISIPELTKAQKGGSKKEDYHINPETFNYEGRPGARYRRDNYGNWLVADKNTKGKFVAVKDSTGKRQAELNKNAVSSDTGKTVNQYYKEFDESPEGRMMKRKSLKAKGINPDLSGPQSAGNSDWFWGPAMLGGLGAKAVISTIPTVAPLVSSALNTAPTWLPGATINNALTAGFAGHGLSEIASGNVAEPWKKAMKSGKGMDYANALGDNVMTVLEVAPLVGPAAKVLTEGLKINKELPGSPNTLQTPEGFQNRVFDSNVQLGSFKGKGHLSEKGYNYRTLGNEEIKAIQESNGVFPKLGKAKGGNENVKYWTKGNEKNWYAENPNQQVIRVKDNKFNNDKVVNATDVEVYNHQTGNFEPISSTTTNTNKNLFEKSPYNYNKSYNNSLSSNNPLSVLSSNKYVAKALKLLGQEEHAVEVMNNYLTKAIKPLSEEQIINNFNKQKQQSLEFWQTSEGRERIKNLLKDNETDITVDDYINMMKDTEYLDKGTVKTFNKQYDDWMDEKILLENTLESKNKLIKRLDKDKETLPWKWTDEQELKLLDLNADIYHIKNNINKIKNNLADHRVINTPKDNAYYAKDLHSVFVGDDYKFPGVADYALAHEWGHAKSLNSRPNTITNKMNDRLINNLDLHEELPQHLNTTKEYRNTQFLKNNTKDTYYPGAYNVNKNPSAYFKNAKDYFLNGGTGLNDEPVAFLNEVRHDLLNKGYIKNLETPVTEELMQKAVNDYRKKHSGKYNIRLYDIVKPTDKSLKTLVTELNNLHSLVLPVTGLAAGSLLTNPWKKDNKKVYSSGGSIELDLTPEEIENYKKLGYSVDYLD